MKQNIIIKITGMHCRNCSDRIQRVVSKMAVEDLIVSYEKGQLSCSAENEDEIIEAINKMGYTAELPNPHNTYKGMIVGIFVLLGFYLIIKNTIGFNVMPEIQEQASYPILFILGIVTSLHCLSMCGGIVLSQSIAFKNPLKSSLLYNVGRIVAYTIVGGIVGGIGSVVSFSSMLKGYITIFAGVFMILMGLSMLQTFAFLRRFVKLPSILCPSSVSQNANTPFFIGLATGLMPCGPLQTMQLYALGTGSVIKGALAMFVFSVGTVPLMMGLGTISGYISGNLNRKLLKASAVLVMALGLIIINRGLSLQGRPTLGRLIPIKQATTAAVLPEVINGYQVIRTYANEKGYEPNYFILEKGTPVKWLIKGDSINYCNNEIMIPDFNIKEKLNEDYTAIEFLPEEFGEIGFSCWMGMLNGLFIVVDDIDNIPNNISPLPADSATCCSD